MSRRAARVSGDLVLRGPGARRLALRVDGSSRALRVRVPSAREATAAAAAVPLETVGRALAALGVVVEVEVGPFPVFRLGEPSRPVRPRVWGALYALLTAPLARLPELVRALRGGRKGGRNGG